MKLDDDKNLKRVYEMIKSGTMMFPLNMIWFAKYLISDYSKKMGKEIEYNYEMNNYEYDYVFDSLGKYRHSMWNEINPTIKVSSDHELTVEEVVLELFKTLGYYILIDEMSEINMNNNFVFDNHAGYTIRQYLIYKETCFSEAIGPIQSNRLYQMYLSENEAIVIGGKVFLDYLDNNFSDQEVFNDIKMFFQKNIDLAFSLIYCKERDYFNLTMDNYIQNNYEYIMDEDSDLIVEFNRDGSKKSLVQLMIYRNEVNKKLCSKLELCNDEVTSAKIQKAIDSNNELYKYFVYSSAERMPIEELIKLVYFLNKEDVEFIMDSLQYAEENIKSIIEAINERFEGEEMKSELLEYWNNRLINCSCIKKSFSDSNNSLLLAKSGN